MDQHGAYKRTKKQIILPLISVLIGTVITFMLVAAYKNYEEAITRSKVELDAMTYAEHIKADVVNGVCVTTVLEEIIISNDGRIDRFPTVAEDLMTGVIHSIQLAPGGVVTEIYPASGNEAGKLDLINDPDRGEVSRYARDSGAMIMQGPFALKQGGIGIAVRNPVYLEREDGSRRFWGFTIAIIRVPEVFSEAVSGLTDLDYDFRLTKTDSPADTTFEEVFSDGQVLEDAAVYPFEIGENRWQLEVSPADGWYSPFDMLFLLVVGLALVLLIAGCQYVLLARSDYRQMVAHNRELQQALAAAQTANRAKTYFLNNMSHDLRTPLNAILGYTRLLEQHKSAPEQADDYLRKIEVSGEQLLSILNNMLDMARLASGEVTLEEQTYYIAPDLDLAERFAKILREKDVSFTQDISVEHRWVRLDPAKVGQILTNLVSNAVKYTPAGGHVHVQVRELPDARPGYAVFQTTVTDDGVGMSEEFQRHLCESFSRERNTTESKVVGIGLGLAIVKRLVDMMGGTIEVRSVQGEGSSFRVTLPQRLADAPAEPADLPEPADDVLADKRILLTEDNDLNAEIAMAILEDLGARVERAEDGAVCVGMLQAAEPGYYDLILMDIQMPNKDGYQAAREIRALPDPVRAGVPIVALTANAFEEDRKKALDAGMDGHLAKPIDVDSLEQTLTDLLRKG